jgi:hypothetical protein
MSLADELAECLTVLLQHHFEPPLYFTCLSGNGMMVYGCYSAVPGQEALRCEIRASIGAEEAFLVLIHILFVDQARDSGLGGAAPRRRGAMRGTAAVSPLVGRNSGRGLRKCCPLGKGPVRLARSTPQLSSDGSGRGRAGWHRYGS